MPGSGPGSGAIRVTSSYAVLGGTGTLSLKTIYTATTTPAGASLPGDLLVLTAASGQTITVTETDGNIRLTAGSIALGGSGQDTLTLLCRGSDWVQVAASDNAV